MFVQVLFNLWSIGLEKGFRDLCSTGLTEFVTPLKNNFVYPKIKSEGSAPKLVLCPKKFPKKGFSKILLPNIHFIFPAKICSYLSFICSVHGIYRQSPIFYPPASEASREVENIT